MKERPVVVPPKRKRGFRLKAAMSDMNLFMHQNNPYTNITKHNPHFLLQKSVVK